MALEVLTKFAFYASSVFQGLFDIVTGKEEYIYDGQGKVVAKLPSKRKQVLAFLKIFLKEPAMVGAVCPSSQFVVDKLLAPVDFKNAKLIVEYGPGIGNISGEILRRMRRDAKLVVFEINPEFASLLKREFHDDRLIACHRSAADVNEVLKEHKLGRPDYIISSIPFSTMEASTAKQIAKATKAVLKPDGKFLVYQYRSKILDFIQPYFRHIDRGYEVVNVPPVRLYFAYD